ncbi:MAG: PTS sugar transporter subunit IIA [Phycisphaerales bacterium]|nr:PTS sugar transporter subunit IIA [Phycisphaerales bacterium]
MQLAKIIQPDRIIAPLNATDKTAAITALVHQLAESGAITRPEMALDAVLKREAERTTGVGFGLAIPHGKVDCCDNVVIAVGKPGTPIDYQSFDNKPVIMIALVISPPAQTSLHIKALADMTRLWHSLEFRDAIASADSPEAVHAAITKFEAAQS